MNGNLIAEIRHALAKNSKKIKGVIDDIPTGKKQRLGLLTNIHWEKPLRIVDIHCDKVSFGLPFKTIRQINSILSLNDKNKWLNITGIDWSGNIRCYSFHIDKVFLETWVWQYSCLIGQIQGRQKFNDEFVRMQARFKVFD